MGFHSTLSGELLVCFVYHDARLRTMKREEQLAGAQEADACWLQAARALRDQLVAAAAAERIDIIGRWKRRRLCCERDFVMEQLPLANNRLVVYKQPEGQFTNPNTACEVECLNWLWREAGEICKLFA